MKLNHLEKALTTSPLRAILQRHYEARLLERLGGRLPQKRVLEIGCGHGVGVEIIFERFGAQVVHALDLDPDMIERARHRLSAFAPDRLQLSVGDAAAIQEARESFDAVFDFGVIHHVPNWKTAVSEVARVLRPGGLFFFEEVTSHALRRWSYRTFLDHPTEDRFSGQQFVAELEGRGIIVGENVMERFFGDFVIGVGRRV
jgi:ubiquinone/menaquinone biosynthesis C-methylase UbiE